MVQKKDVLYTVVFTLHNEEEITVTDTAEALVASAALKQFLNYKTAVVEGENDTTYIPFHAVIKVVATKQTTEKRVEDETCKEA